MKQIFLYINLIVILIGVTLLSSCTKPSDRTPLAMEKGEFSNHESRKENTPPSQSETNAKEERKEFTFFDISVREIYGGLGNSTGSIGGVTSFYASSGTSLPDFEIMEENIAEKFSDKKAYLLKFSESEMLVCTLPTGGNCFNTKGTLVEEFIKKNNL